MPEINDIPFDQVISVTLSSIIPMTPLSLVAVDPTTVYVYPDELDPSHILCLKVSVLPSEMHHSPDMSLHPEKCRKSKIFF